MAHLEMRCSTNDHINKGNFIFVRLSISLFCVSDSVLSLILCCLCLILYGLCVSDSALSVSDSGLTVSDSVLSCCQKSRETAAQSEGPHLMRMSRKAAVLGQLQPQTLVPCDSSHDRDLWRTRLKSHFPPTIQSANVIAHQVTSPQLSAAWSREGSAARCQTLAVLTAPQMRSCQQVPHGNQGPGRGLVLHAARLPTRPRWKSHVRRRDPVAATLTFLHQNPPAAPLNTRK